MRVGSAVTSDEQRRLITLLGLATDIGQPEANGYHLFGAWRDDDLLGASAWFRAADGSAMLVRPWTSSASAAVVTELYLAMTSDAQAAGSRYALALTNPDDPWHKESLQAAQFSRLSEFFALSRRLDRRDRHQRGVNGPFVEYADDTRERFHAIFAATQLESDDCAGLRSLRSTEEAFAMFAAAGRFRPEDWLLLKYDSHDAALLLMNETADAAAFEIAYLGVIPELRRQGIGRGLVAEAIRRAASRDSQKIMTAVDIENVAARNIYDRFGFIETSRHQMFLKPLLV